MEQIIKKMMDMGIGQIRDKRQELCMSDTTYLKDNEDEGELEQRYAELDLTRQQRLLVNDYIACMRTAHNRYADLSYMAGVRDAVRMLARLDGSKEIKLSKKIKKDILGWHSINDTKGAGGKRIYFPAVPFSFPAFEENTAGRKVATIVFDTVPETSSDSTKNVNPCKSCIKEL